MTPELEAAINAVRKVIDEYNLHQEPKISTYQGTLVVEGRCIFFGKLPGTELELPKFEEGGLLSGPTNGEVNL